MSAKTIFESLGLAVMSVESGVYRVQRRDEQGNPKGDAVGLLLSDTPLTPQSNKVKLFLHAATPDVPAARIVYHWQTLDARRFEESGLDPLELELSAAQIPERVIEQRYTRPDGVRIRHTVKLVTGEVVCYN
ncbi:hypothetical protein [Burkholderia ubonensis]|uniref:hypothetical protein n=1 Tax=Burkholderia ubonensis TaxID=101571 RepID=UPI0012F8B1B2|nr:hypothetical protein [Burkholderia ubonensis]